MTKYAGWPQEGDSGNREKLSGTKACRCPPIAIRSWPSKPSSRTSIVEDLTPTYFSDYNTVIQARHPQNDPVVESLSVQ
jgi:hypothetical protein